jgi:hypothetical protein
MFGVLMVRLLVEEMWRGGEHTIVVRKQQKSEEKRVQPDDQTRSSQSPRSQFADSQLLGPLQSGNSGFAPPVEGASHPRPNSVIASPLSKFA